MSATITSTVVASSTTFAYAYEGATGTSISRESATTSGNTVVRRNFATAATIARLGTVRDYSTTDSYAGVQWSGFTASNTGNAVRVQVPELTNGTRLAAGVLLANPSDSLTVIAKIDVGDENTVEVSLAPREQRRVGTTAAPSNATLQFLDIALGTPEARLLFRQIIIETQITQAGDYFDGSTAGRTIVKQESTAPTLILGYETARRSQNLYHDVLGGGQDVTLRAAALRSGTLRLFYPSEADAAAAMTMHAKSALFYVSDPDRPSITMYYALDGTLSLELDSGRNVWTLAVGYQEVTP